MYKKVNKLLSLYNNLEAVSKKLSVNKNTPLSQISEFKLAVDIIEKIDDKHVYNTHVRKTISSNLSKIVKDKILHIGFQDLVSKNYYFIDNINIDNLKQISERFPDSKINFITSSKVSERYIFEIKAKVEIACSSYIIDKEEIIKDKSEETLEPVNSNIKVQKIEEDLCCFYCRVKLYGLEYQLDHIIPSSILSKLSVNYEKYFKYNTVISCSNCNLEKGNKSIFDFVYKDFGKHKMQEVENRLLRRIIDKQSETIAGLSKKVSDLTV